MKQVFTCLLLALLFVNLSCRNDDLVDETVEAEELVQPETSDWSEATHSNLVDPDYSIVFNQNEVLRFDIVIDGDDWATMQADLTANLGSSIGGRPKSTELTEFDPVWVPCSFNFNDTEWYEVGIRFKGNSSLSSTYTMGIEKYSFKLDFDQFEDDYPAIENQRFYGFKQLNLKNNFNDASMVREKVASDLYLDFGIPSPQTTFCEVYVDYGSGPIYFGVYTLVEEPDDSMIDSQFADGNGNLYKPDGDAAAFSSGSYNESEMEKKNNEDEADYSDVYSLYTIINSSDRTSNVEQWKTNLEQVFNVDHFMKWLAANIVMQNWDTYGIMTHNYYLYNNPSDSLLTWIPWDNNEALQEGKQSGALSLSLSEVSSSWPLIRYLIDIPEYKAMYDAYLQEFIDNVFEPTRMETIYSGYYTMLKDYVYNELSTHSFLTYNAQFDEAIAELKSHVSERNTAVENYLE